MNYSISHITSIHKRYINLQGRRMAVGYKKMAEINLNLSELCFEAEAEAEKCISQCSECE